MLDINSTEYYVYGLCDPTTDEVFYIGKGKGNRAEQHLVEKEKTGQGNRDKLKKIKEILSSKKEIKIIYYITNIKEEAAFFLEEILIERIGQKPHGGTLTNILEGNTSEYYKLSLNSQYGIKNEV